jgi:hypothetical protein
MGFENGSLARVVLRAELASNSITTVLHYDLQHALLEPAPSLQALADRIRDDVIPAWRACIIPDWTIQPVEVIDELDPLHPDANRTSVTSGSPQAGLRLAAPSAEIVPIEMCGMATLHTGRIGRSFRGRIFMPPLWSDNSMSDGVLSGAQFVNYQGLVASIPLEPDIVTGGGTGTANLCVYSRTRRALNHDPYAQHVTSISLANTVRWLRSRGK